AGEAVVRDAIRRVERLDVGERFPVRAGRKMLLPVLPALIAFAIAFFVDERGQQPTVEAVSAAEVDEQIKKSTEDLRQRIEERKKKAAEQGLKDVDDLFNKLEDGLKDAGDEPRDRKRALVKLNNLADQLQQRRQEVGGAEAIQKQLEKMKDLQDGPADKMAKAMKQGDFKGAMDEFNRLSEKLQAGELSDNDKQALAEQLEQLQDKLAQAANEHRQAMQDLQQQIDQAQQQGNLAQAGQLQQQLDKLAQQGPQNAQLDKLAQQLGEAAEAMKNGDSQQMQQSLADLQSQLDDLRQQQAQSELLDQLDQEMQLAKESMKCEQCAGGGCSACQGQGEGQGEGEGQGDGSGQGQQPGGAMDNLVNQSGRGDGIGAGRGHGERAEAEDAAGLYDSKVDLKVGRGDAIITGEADGPNIKGRVNEAIQTEFRQAGQSQADP
ncbi:MAG: hypothetical protein WD030_02160, partial [Pirellulales bacterium]